MRPNPPSPLVKGMGTKGFGKGTVKNAISGIFTALFRKAMSILNRVTELSVYKAR